MFGVKSFLKEITELMKKIRHEISILPNKMLYFKQLFSGVQEIN